jgi:hypothetical protein
MNPDALQAHAISPGLRIIAYLTCAAHALTGAVLFVVPSWASEHFAWRVSPLVAMTIGGWCLGTACLAYVIAHRANWPMVVSPAVYLGAFGILETGVLVAFRTRLLLASPLAWIYVAALLLACLFAVAAAIEAWHRRPVLVQVGAPFGGTTLILTVIFILFVGFLGFYGLLAVDGMPGLNGGIFPERLSMFSLRAFGAFYLSLALGATPLLRSRGRGNVLTYGFAAYSLIVLITIAAFVFIDRFNLVAHPTQAIYIGVYLLVGAVVGIYLLRYGSK